MIFNLKVWKVPHILCLKNHKSTQHPRRTQHCIISICQKVHQTQHFKCASLKTRKTALNAKQFISLTKETDILLSEKCFLQFSFFIYNLPCISLLSSKPFHFIPFHFLWSKAIFPTILYASLGCERFTRVTFAIKIEFYIIFNRPWEIFHVEIL